jgi:general secretion pathway protein I
MRAPRDEGFTLVEAMVALVVLAVATAGLIRASEAHIDRIGGLQSRVVAQWVAENRLVELGLAHSTSTGDPLVEMLGRKWAVHVASKATDDPDLAAVDVAVSEPGAASPLVTLGGFVDIGKPVS